MLSSRQIAEWMAYYSLEPWGERPAFLRSGIIASVIANVHRGKGRPTFSVADFMPREIEQRSTPQQSIEQQKQMLLAWARAAEKAGVEVIYERRRRDG